MLDLADLQWQKGLPDGQRCRRAPRRNPTASDSAVKAVHECESIMKSFMKAQLSRSVLIQRLRREYL